MPYTSVWRHNAVSTSFVFCKKLTNRSLALMSSTDVRNGTNDLPSPSPETADTPQCTHSVFGDARPHFKRAFHRRDLNPGRAGESRIS